MSDYVIVGAGSAGCVLANRLSANPDVEVLLLEAGGSDKKMEIRMPAGYGKLFKSELDWDYETQAEPHIGDRKLYIPRGKVIGGSSSINAMLYVRGSAGDYDRWAEAGCPGWSYDDCLPFFKRSQGQTRGESDYHGVDGPLVVSDQRSPNQLSHAFVEAAAEAGLPRNEDFNGESQLGVGLYQVTQRRGRRWSSADAFLHPAEGRPNLTVVSEALATRIVFEGTRATGVEYERKGQTHTANADVEVIVCGGAINSPQLLMLSGVGPADALAALDIEVVADLAGVGQNLQDHPVVPLLRRCTQKITLLHAEKLRYVLQYLLFRRGPLTTCVAEAGGFIDTGSGLTGPDIQYHYAPVLYSDHGLEPPTEDGVSCGPTLVAPTSRGQLSLRSADPRERPAIVTNAMSDEAEMRAMVEGFKVAREILACAPLADFLGEELAPGSEVTSDADIAQHVRDTVELLYHPAGTCKMGTDDAAVVGPELRVHGLDGLRVVDASVMPTVTSGNTNAPTIMIAERAAEFLTAA